jgi:hypothetical protein
MPETLTRPPSGGLRLFLDDATKRRLLLVAVREERNLTQQATYLLRQRLEELCPELDDAARDDQASRPRP